MGVATARILREFLLGHDGRGDGEDLEGILERRTSPADSLLRLLQRVEETEDRWRRRSPTRWRRRRRETEEGIYRRRVVEGSYGG